jgi:acetyltransferase-like isoleucine patch superfamily enzyme
VRDEADVASARRLDSGVRKYAQFSLAHALRRAWTLRGVSARGDGIYVEPNVRLLRHPEKISLGANVMLKEGARLCPTNPDASISIGDWTTIGYHCFLFAATRIEIGANCLVAPFCYFVDSNHGTAPGQLIRQQPMTARAIIVGSDVWLGTGVAVMPGVSIGDGAVIGARSVVAEDIPPGAIAVGSPARVVRFRE